MKKAVLSFFYFLSGFSFRDRKKIVFGSWMGERISDNPYYLLQDLIHSDDKRLKNKEYIWIAHRKCKEQFYTLFDKEMKEKKIKFVTYGTLKSYYYILISNYFFCSHSYYDFSKINLTKNGIVFQLWHGVPLKKIVCDNANEVVYNAHKYEHYDYFITSSSKQTEILKSAFRQWNPLEDKFLKIGQPRNKMLLKESMNQENKRKIRNRIKIDMDKIIISYLPTFRDKTHDIFSFEEFCADNTQFLLDNNIVIIERQHQQRVEDVEFESEVFHLISNKVDTQELLLITDILITDYSSVYFDFMLLNKPIIHFLYDGDYYEKSDRGLYFNIEDVAGGPIVNTTDKLLELFGFVGKSNSEDTFDCTIRQKNSEKFNEYEVEDYLSSIIEIIDN